MGFRWGVQWGKVGTGGALLLIGGGISLALWFADGIIGMWAGGTAVIGLFSLLSGLMGEEGIW